MSTAALILAAGRSERFGRDKLAMLLEDKPVWKHSFDAFYRHPNVDLVGIVCPERSIDAFRSFAPEAAFVVAGGSSRQASCLNGLKSLPQDVEWVMIHDAARPFVSAEQIRDCLDSAREHGAACPGLPVSDTIKELREGRWTTIDRSRLVAVQTPQVGRRSDFLRAHETTEEELTDDMALLERIGISPAIVEGDGRNMKLTTPEDLERAHWRNEPSEIRTGLGYDIHAFSTDPSRTMILGGVEFEDRPGLDGHSDADALIHAMVDALLGAAGLGDIGLLYPNTDSRWKDASSLLFLKETGELLRSRSWQIVNVDGSVLAERPKIMPRRSDICAVVADALEIDRSRVSVKATTNERLGAIGRGEGVAAFAVATIRRFAH